jgi:phospholipase/lecithinase/hemolysin
MRIRTWSSFPPASTANSLSRRRPSNTDLFRLRTLLSFAALAVLSCAAALAQAHTYSTVVVFGDSLSDTGNVLHLSLDKYHVPVPGPVLPLEDYTLGRFTDGPDSTPAALNYFGVWIEQLAAALPGQPLVYNSLDGGTNYAYGFATTANTTSTLFFGPGNSYSVQIENIGQQITDYLATHPQIDDHTLFVVWGGAIDLLYATSARDVSNAAVQQTHNIQRLIQAGATQFLVPNLPPLGVVPRLNGSLTTSVPASAASLLYNSYLATGIALLKELYLRRHLAVYQLDVFHVLLNAVASPGSYSLTNVKDPAQGLAVNPDTYLFWDDVHPTTRGHNILATAAINLMSH